MVTALGLDAPHGRAERWRYEPDGGFTARVGLELVVAESHGDTDTDTDVQSDVTVIVSMPGGVLMLPKGC